MSHLPVAISDPVWERYLSAHVNEQYHQAVRRRLELVQSWLTLVAALSGLAAGAAWLAATFPWFPAVLATASGVSATVAGVFSFSDRAAVHRSLAVCYRMHREELALLVKDEDPSPQEVERALARYAATEMREADRAGAADVKLLARVQRTVESALGLERSPAVTQPEPALPAA